MALMSSFKLPCGTKNFYPEKLDYITRKDGHVVFHTMSSKDGKSYLVHPLKKGIEILEDGKAMEIVERYESIDLPEHQIVDPNGIFLYKQASSKEEFEAALK